MIEIFRGLCGQSRSAATIWLSEINLRQDISVATRLIKIKVVKVSEGDLPTKKAAYISRSSLRSAVTGERFSWRSKRKDLVYSAIMLPEGVDEAFRDPEHLWSSMERPEIRSTPRRSGPLKQTKAEHRALIAQIDHPGPKRLTAQELAPAWREDAQFAYHVILPVPHEFSEAQNRALIEEFVQGEFLEHGFICHVAFHRPDPDSPLNWHAHLLIPTREVTGGRVGNKLRGVLANFANRTGGAGYIIPDGNWPDRWFAHQEDFARRHGIAIDISPKSPVPLPDIGAAIRIDGSDQAEVLAATRADAAAALEVPGLLPELLTETQPTFTFAEALALAMGKSGVRKDPDSIARVLMDYPALVPLFEAETGQFAQRFTINAVREQERDLARSAADLRRRTVHPTRRQALWQAVKDTTSGGKDAAVADSLAGVSGSRLSLIEPRGTDTTRLLLALRRACRRAGYTCLDLAPNVGSAGIRRSHRPRRSLAHELLIQERLEAGTYDAGARDGETESPADQRKPTKARKRDIPRAWDRKTCILLSAADQLDADGYLRLFDRAARTGARVILIGAAEPRRTIGRGGAYVVVRAAITNAGSDVPTIRLPGAPGHDARQASLAYAAAGDRAETIRAAAAAGTRATSALPAPRPWRWPGAGLIDIHNLSLASDCNAIERRLAALPPAEMLAVYRTLPLISDSGHDPTRHPLVMLHRQVRGHLRTAGIDGRFGRTDVDCLKQAQVTSTHSWRDRADLAPRSGYVDVRPLLAAISFSDMADWHALVERMKRYPDWVLRDIVGGLDHLFDRAKSDEVRYALSLVRLHMFVMAKDTGRDLVPETARQDLWSIISSADRIHPDVRFDDRDGSVPLILAATLPPPGYRKQEPIIIPRQRTTQPKEPIWLRRPAWSPLDEFGAHPEGGERRRHFLALRDASDEQRSGYQDALLRVYAASRDLAMRAWCAVGLQHCASWHRQTGTPMSIELEIADETANFAVSDWRSEQGYQGNPFEAARAQFWLERLAGSFLDADTRDRQLALAEKIAAAPRPPSDAPKRYKELLSTLQRPANHLRLRDGIPDPVIFGALIADLKRRLGEPTDDGTVNHAARPEAQASPAPPQMRQHELAL